MNQKHYIIIILLLVVLNVFSWRMWWERPTVEKNIKQRVEHLRGKDNAEEKGLRFLISKLDLTAEQEQQFKALRYSHFKQMKNKDEDLDKLKNNLMQALADDNEIQQKEIIEEMAQIKGSIETEMIDHFISMRRICTSEQQVNFDLLFGKMLFHKDKGFNRGGPNGKEGRGRERKMSNQDQD